MLELKSCKFSFDWKNGKVSKSVLDYGVIARLIKCFYGLNENNLEERKIRYKKISVGSATMAKKIVKNQGKPSTVDK